MKRLYEILKKQLPTKNVPQIVDRIAVIGGWRMLENPRLSTELQCLICECKDHYAPFVDPYSSHLSRVWLCANNVCMTMQLENCRRAISTPIIPKRAILWSKFCELNGIGDIHHSVRFEDVQQSHGKIAYMLEFLKQPKGILHMEGKAGTGKTFAAMALCESFTRKDVSCIFCTQKQMISKWLETFKDLGFNNYIEKVLTTSLLVIDDFGVVDPSSAFMSFFFDLINARLQWTNRGTVITTNLTKEKLTEVCGEALIDRIGTGQHFLFDQEHSRRVKQSL